MAAVKIVGVSMSPRAGKTTAAALRVALDSARAVSERVETELIELAGLDIDGDLAAGLPAKPGRRDDFLELARRIAAPEVAGLILASPVYFGSMTALGKAFLDRLAVFRKDFGLRNKVAGALAVGGSRNGGQELTVQALQAPLFYHDMIVVGDGAPMGHLGAMLWVNKDDDVTRDPFGLEMARSLGRRVAEVAMLVAGNRG